MNTIADFISTHDFDTRAIYILHDFQGGIRKILSPSGGQFQRIIHELIEAESLAKYYSFQSFDTAKARNQLPEKTKFKNHPNYIAFYTNYPISTLITQRAFDDLWLGRIVFKEFTPNIETAKVNGIIMIDRTTEQLAGFDHKFLVQTGIHPEQAPLLLGKPLHELITPTPSQFIDKNALSFKKADLGRLSPIFHNFFKESNLPEGILLSHPEAFKIASGGLQCESGVKDSIFLTLPHDIDNSQVDFLFEITFKASDGMPYLTLGGPYLGMNRIPDEGGYFAGFSYENPELQLKKISQVIHSTPIGKIDENRFHKLTFVGIGMTFFILLDDEPLLKYFDKDVYLSSTWKCSIGIRPGVKVTIQEITLKVAQGLPEARPALPEEHIVRLKPETEHRFLLEKYHIASLRYIAYDFYMLYNITDMQRVIDNLARSMKMAEAKGRKLKNLLDRYRLGERMPLGNSPAISAVRNVALTAAKTDATVLLEGETGTGKEIMAQYIHENSLRKNNPLVKIDCSTIPPALIESHLFGHEKGAFTGAVDQTIGLLEKSSNGTLFLDEVSNLPLSTQAKLLQFFNDFTISRIGGNNLIRVNTRCIVATNKNLEEMVRDGLFREDLYYRLSVIHIRLPRLKERTDDIPELAQHFLEYFSGLHSKAILGFSSASMQKLIHYPWPGNVRELRNTIENSVVFCESETVEPEQIIFRTGTTESSKKKRHRQPFKLGSTRPEIIQELLLKHYGSVLQVAKTMGVSKVALYAYLKQNNIPHSTYRRGYGELPL